MSRTFNAWQLMGAFICGLLYWPLLIKLYKIAESTRKSQQLRSKELEK